MIVVKLELWPGGDERRSREIGRTYIANIGGTDERGDYSVAVCRKDNFAVPANIFTDSGHDPRSSPKACREGQVHDYPRLSYNVWRLIIRALKNCFPEEK